MRDLFLYSHIKFSDAQLLFALLTEFFFLLIANCKEKNDYEIKEYLKACAESYNELGEIYYDKMEDESALNMYGAAMDKLSSIDTESIDEIAYLSGTVLYNMARVYYDMGDRRNALDCAMMSVDILERDQVLGSLIIDDARALLRMIKGR